MREEITRCIEQELERTERRKEGIEGGEPVVRGSLLPAQAMRVRAYICVRTYGGNAYARSNEKRKCIHRTKKKLHSRGRKFACVYPLTSVFDWSVNILFRAESDLHMQWGSVPVYSSFSLLLSERASVWDIIRMMLQSGERKVHLNSTCMFQF